MNQGLSGSKITDSIIFVLGFITFSFLFVPQANAAINYTTGYYDTSPSYTTSCSDTSGCSTVSTCWNSWAVGGTDCGDACGGGNEWTKYGSTGCYQTYYDPTTGDEDCETVYVESATVCSTADKCYLEPYLKAGYCECIVGETYKTCCTNTTPSLVSGDSCVQSEGDPTNPPYEGVCPAGTHSEFCGFSTYPNCGQAACGTLVSSQPPL